MGDKAQYTEQIPKPTAAMMSLSGVSLLFTAGSRQFDFGPGGNMWWIFGIALAIVIAAAFVLTRRPSRRTTIVLERD